MIRAWASVAGLALFAAIVALGSTGVGANADSSRLKEVALHLAEASRIAQAPGVHSSNVDTYLLNNGFQHIAADAAERFLPGMTMRRPLTLVYFGPNGVGTYRRFGDKGEKDEYAPIAWWRSRMGLCFHIDPEKGGPGRQCAIFYQFDSTVVALMIDHYGLMSGPGRAHFFKGNRTDTQTWGAAMRLSP